MIDNPQWWADEHAEYQRKLELYLNGKIKECPQCGQDNGHHKMDCGVRYEQDVRNVQE